MNQQVEAMKLAIEAADELEWMLKSGYEQRREGPPRVHRLIGKIKALAQPAQQQEQEQEPVAIVDDSGVIVVCSYHYKPGDKLYTVSPAQRKPLTDEELEEIVKRGAENKPFHHWFARAIEAAHGIKTGGAV